MQITLQSCVGLRHVVVLTLADLNACSCTAYFATQLNTGVVATALATALQIRGEFRTSFYHLCAKKTYAYSFFQRHYSTMTTVTFDARSIYEYVTLTFPQSNNQKTLNIERFEQHQILIHHILDRKIKFMLTTQTMSTNFRDWGLDSVNQPFWVEK